MGNVATISFEDQKSIKVSTEPWSWKYRTGCSASHLKIHLLSNTARSQSLQKLLKQNLPTRSFPKFLEKHQRTTAVNPMLFTWITQQHRSMVFQIFPSSIGLSYNHTEWYSQTPFQFTNFCFHKFPTREIEIPQNIPIVHHPPEKTREE